MKRHATAVVSERPGPPAAFFSQRRHFATTVAIIALIVFIIISVYEWLVHLLLAEPFLERSHLISICLGTLAAALGASFALRRYDALRRHTQEEERLRRQAEEAQHALTERTHQLEQVVDELRNQIAGRVGTEQKLHDEERFLASVFSSIQDGISILDSNYVIQSVNPTMERWYAHAMPLVGRKCFEAYHCQTEPCEKCPTRRTLATGEAAFEVVEKGGPSGQVVGWLDLYSFPLRASPGGEVRGVIEYVRDISDRKAAEEALRAREEQYRSLFENAAEVIYTVSLPDRAFVSLNPAFEHLTGWSRAEWIGKPITDLIHPDDLAGIEEAVGVLLSGRPAPPTLLRARRKSGDYLTMEATGILVRRDQQPVALYGIARDVTTRHRLEEQLRQSQKMDAIGQLAGGISHDFNNLLTAITGFSELVLERLKPEDPLRKDVEGIEKAASQAASLTRQLLAFSRQQMLQPKVLDLNAVVAETEKVLRRVIGEDIDLAVHLSPGIDRIKADPGQIEQVLLNLAVNARDAMPQGGKMTIRTEMASLAADEAERLQDARPGRFVCLSVTDSGAGMEPAILGRIFEPFFTTKEHGTGLGLATVYGVAKQHGGWVNVFSRPGAGSTFKLYLPAFALEAELTRETGAPTEQLRGHGERILMVEDREEVREFAVKALTGNGYVVLRAANTNDAATLFAREDHGIDLLFADVVLPDGSGIALAEKLRTRHPGLRVLFTSGYTDEKSQWPMIRDRGLPFLRKPYTLSGLLQMVHQVLHEPERASRE